MKLLVILALTFFSFSSKSEDLYIKDAVKKTKELMTNRQKRNAAIKKDPMAVDADKKAGALAGSEKNKDKMYGIASEVFEKVVESTNGDEKKMQELLKKAEKNPEAFYNEMFSDEQKAELEALSKDIENSQKAKSTKP